MAIQRRLSCAAWLCAWLLVPGPSAAQVDIDEYWLSADTNVRIPLSDGSGNVLADDRSTIIVLPDGTGNAQAPNVIFDFDGADVDAFHHTLRQTSLDTAREIDGVLVRPGDVFYMAGSAPIITFDAAAAGIPDGVNLDAVTVDPDTGQLVVSFDRWFLEPTFGFVLPGDLVTVTAGQLDTLAFNGTQLGDGVNLDAAHQLGADRYLISVDVDAFVPGGPGAWTIRDHDIVLYEPSAPRGVLGTFTPLLSLADDSHPSWIPADLDALWADPAPLAGEIRVIDTFFEVQESSGTLSIRVERVNGSDGPVGIFLDAVADTATEGADFSGDIAYTALWADGEAGVRTIDAVDIIDDALEEPFERFGIVVSIFSGDATVGSPDRATARVIDNDGDNLFADGFET